MQEIIVRNKEQTLSLLRNAVKKRVVPRKLILILQEIAVEERNVPQLEDKDGGDDNEEDEKSPRCA